MYYNFSDHTTDMNKVALHGLNELLKVYDVIASYHLNDNSKREILGKGIFVCRYCGKSKPEVKFKKDAHAIPHFTGNNTLFSHKECDTCNEKFGRLLESNFAGFMHIDHLISGIKGKNGYLKFKTNDALIETDGSLIDWSNVPDENLTVDKPNSAITIKQKMPTFTPIGVYKCLVKMAMSIFPDEELPGFANTIKWLCEENHCTTNFKFSKLWLLQGTSSTQHQFNDRSAIVLKKKDENDLSLPTAIFRLTYANFLFQVPIPLYGKDDLSKWKGIPYIPSLIDLKHGYGIMKLELIDLHSVEPIKGMVKDLTITDLDGTGTYQDVYD